VQQSELEAGSVEVVAFAVMAVAFAVMAVVGIVDSCKQWHYRDKHI
jgi:hypothetical protein